MLQAQKHMEMKLLQQNKFKAISDTKLRKRGDFVEAKDTLAQECIVKWVKNCSDHILSEPDLSVLKKGLNFVVTPTRLPVVDLVTATESGCRQLGGGDTNELRSKVVNILSKGEKVLEKDHTITREALDGLKKDDTIMVLTVVMDKQR